MDTLAAGAFRLAAAKNDLPTLDVLQHVPHFDINVAMVGFTALHAAAVRGHAGNAQ